MIFGTVPQSVDLTAEVLRDDAVWLTSAYVLLGTYSFVEPILVAPELDISILAQDPQASPPSLGDAAAGGRFVAKLAGIKTEAGYLSVQAGEETNLYCLRRDGGLGPAAGMQYIFQCPTVDNQGASDTGRTLPKRQTVNIDRDRPPRGSCARETPRDLHTALVCSFYHIPKVVWGAIRQLSVVIGTREDRPATPSALSRSLPV